MVTTATADNGEAIDGELVAVESAEGALAQLNASEIDTQIATAKRFPRSLKRFKHEALEMATLDEETASECMYALPRGRKTIQGPSARLAEIIASAWGNCRAGARVISTDSKFVTAQGMFLDLQRNVAITYEVKRRITDKYGETFNDDMIGVTANAACSIALRNAVFKGVPKALWRSIYEAAKQTAIGDVTTLANKRAKAIEAFGKMGASEEMILGLFEIDGVDDITLDHLAILRGLHTAIKDGDTTIEMAFAPPPGSFGSKVRKSDLDSRLTKPPAENPKAEAQPEPTTEPGPPTAEELAGTGEYERDEPPAAPNGQLFDGGDGGGTYGREDH